MRGVLMRECLRALRSEVGHSTSVVTGMNAEDSLVTALDRTQLRLWESWPWPHLIVSRAVPISSGQRYYNVPEDLHFERILSLEVRDADRWMPLDYGIESRHYEVYDSDLDQRCYPPTNWYVTEDPQDTAGNIDGRGMIEIWPLPDRNHNSETLDATLRFRGVRLMRPFRAQTDRCELDHSLIVLYAAAEILARQKSADAEFKLAQAQQMQMQLRGAGQKRKDFTFGTPCADERWPVHPTYVTSRHPGRT